VSGPPSVSKLREHAEKIAAQQGQTVGSSRPHAPGFDMSSSVQKNAMMMPLISVGTALMGSGGPVGYDASGMMMTSDLNNQMQPETDRCFGLEETWLKQCSAPAQVYLEIESTVGPGAASKEDKGANDKQARAEIRSAMFVESKTQFGEKQVHDIFRKAWKQKQMLIRAKNQLPLRFGKTQGAAHSNNPEKAFFGSSVSFLQLPGDATKTGSEARFMLQRPGSVTSGESSFTLQPTHVPGTASALATGSRPGFNFDQSINGMLSDVTAASKVQVEQTDVQTMASYASEATKGLMGQASAMGGVPSPMNVGTITAGPDYYDPTGPDGAEPSELQTSGPQKCTRMLNAWLYKCALSPL